MNNEIKRIKGLVTLLNNARNNYYNQAQEIMSNKNYDELYDELESLEKKNKFILNVSPTRTVGYEIKSKLKKIIHDSPMLSLQKTKNIQEIKEWVGNREGILSWKLDGLTIVLKYNNGELQQAITRGNGTVGEDITHNARTFINLPQNINYKGYLEIRGEGIISYKDFQNINDSLPIEKQYQNPRNLSSGSVRQLDSKICKQRKVRFITFNTVKVNKKFNTMEEQFDFLNNLGFEVVNHEKINKNNIEQKIEEFTNKAKDFNYPVDGLVVCYNDLNYREHLGSTLHHPLGWYALKWEDKSKQTILRNVQWQVGRTGNLTPVAIFDIVELEGTNVNKASVHNLSLLKSLELGIGDKITVYKANKIIPQIEKNLTRSNNIKIPNICPICGEELKIKKSNRTEFLYCSNLKCDARLSQKIKHYCSKSAMNIDGFSIKTILKFIDMGFIKNIVDIYKLQNYREEIINMEGFKEKSYNNLISSIEKSKECKLNSFIYALGIPNVGLDASRLICKKFNNNLNLILEATEQDFLSIDGIGRVTVNDILKWMSDTKNRDLLNNLLKYIIFIKEEDKKEIKNGVFSDMKIYCTGTFENYKKKQLKEIAITNGGTFANGYAKSLNLLVVGNKKSSGKVDKAKIDNVKVITENEFINMIK